MASGSGRGSIVFVWIGLVQEQKERLAKVTEKSDK
ncbi:hypothetical protein CCACVL1_05170 [Corchorus capsularis]|uniref:Uncharacterized protein n=1 Tax=Corchorus capsularis TaxID=210143 RepID=A0A1R3JM83_COCAP|nr:hypothetical protein CCACVL1_05170 [Corchorus capsularis]